MSRFEKGKKVICINDGFRITRTDNPDTQHLVGKVPPTHPKNGEVLEVNDVCELYGFVWLNFREYNNGEDARWWVAIQFRPIDEIEIIMNISEPEVEVIGQPRELELV